MKKRWTVAELVLLLTVMTLPLHALAVEGDGDGSGGGSGEPLMLESSSVPDGDTDVAPDVIITLTFSKNVVNFTVKDNNMACFALTDSAGNAAAFSVLMGDDQVDPTIKNNIEIAPEQLLPGTAYHLTILKELTSKSGVQMTEDVVIRFTTAAQREEPAAPPAAAAPSEDSAAAAAETAAAEPSAAEAGTEAPVTAPAPEPEASKTPQMTEETGTLAVANTEESDSAADTAENQTNAAQPFPWYIPVAVLAVLGAAGGGVAYSRRKK